MLPSARRHRGLRRPPRPFRPRWGVLVAVAAALLPAAPAGAATGDGPPRPAAAAWIVAAPGRGGVLAMHAAGAERPVASLTKLMTARLVLQDRDLDRTVVTGPRAATVGESVVGLELGERQTLRALLEALVVRSANDAAVALAAGVAGSEEAFVARMNAEARRLGLRETAYRTPYGLDTPGQHSSARDVLRLAIDDMGVPLFRQLAAQETGAIPGHPPFATRNTLLARYAGADGVKTGHTDLAGWCLAASAVRDGVRLYVVVLGAPTEARRDADVARLLDWGFDRFQEVPLVRRGDPYGSLPVPWGGGSVPVVAGRSVEVVARRRDRFRERVVLPDQAPTPLRAGQRVGTVVVEQDGRAVGRVPLVAARGAASPDLLDKAAWVAGEAIGTLTGPFGG